MKKIILALLCFASFGFAGLNNVEYDKTFKKKEEHRAVALVRKMVLSKEIRDLIGFKIDPITQITNIYQGVDDRKNIVYEYTVNTNKEKSLKESDYGRYAVFLWEQNLPNVCASNEMKMFIKLGVGARYIYLDSNGKTIADMTIGKKDCDSLE